MPRAQPKTVKSTATSDTVISTTTETVLATVSNLATDNPQEKIKLRGWAQVTTGANTTALTFRIRRGTGITGTVVGEGNPIDGSIVAAKTFAGGVDTQDQPGSVAGQSYVLTVEQTGATTDGAGVQASLEAVIGT